MQPWIRQQIITFTNIFRSVFSTEALAADHRAKIHDTIEHNINLRILPALNQQFTSTEKFDWFLTREEQLEWLKKISVKINDEELARDIEGVVSEYNSASSVFKKHAEKFVLEGFFTEVERKHFNWFRINDLLTPLKGVEITASEAVYSRDHGITAEKLLNVLTQIIAKPNSSVAEIECRQRPSRLPFGEVSVLYNGMGIDTMRPLFMLMSHLFKDIPHTHREKLLDDTRDRIEHRTPEGSQLKVWAGTGVYLAATGSLTIADPSAPIRRASSRPSILAYRMPPMSPVYSFDGQLTKKEHIKNKYFFGNMAKIWHNYRSHTVHEITHDLKHATTTELDDGSSIFGLTAPSALIVYNLSHISSHGIWKATGIGIGIICSSIAWLTSIVAGDEYDTKWLKNWVEKKTGHSFTESGAKHLSSEEIALREKVIVTKAIPSPYATGAIGTNIDTPAKSWVVFINSSLSEVMAKRYLNAMKNKDPEFITNQLPFRLRTNEVIINAVEKFLVEFTLYNSIEIAARRARKMGHHEYDVPPNHQDKHSQRFTAANNEFKQTIQRLCNDNTSRAIFDIVPRLFRENFGEFVGKLMRENVIQRVTVTKTSASASM